MPAKLSCKHAGAPGRPYATTVLTGYHLIHAGHERGRLVRTEVSFRELAGSELDGYVASGEWEGKAGGYAIQGLAAAFVRTVRGSYTNVVGLPLCEVIEDLLAIGALPERWALERHGPKSFK